MRHGYNKEKEDSCFFGRLTFRLKKGGCIMKKSWAYGGFFGGYLYLFTDGCSIYMLIASALTCLLHIWRNYASDTAMLFSALLVGSVAAILLLLHRRMDDLHPMLIKEDKAWTIFVDLLLGIVAVVACIIDFLLAIQVILFVAVPQLIIWLEETLNVYNKNDELSRFRCLVQGLLGVILVIMPAVITIILLVLWLNVNVSNAVKGIVVVVYLLLIPCISRYQDDMMLSVYEILDPNM